MVLSLSILSCVYYELKLGLVSKYWRDISRLGSGSGLGWTQLRLCRSSDLVSVWVGLDVEWGLSWAQISVWLWPGTDWADVRLWCKNSVECIAVINRPLYVNGVGSTLYQTAAEPYFSIGLGSGSELQACAVLVLSAVVFPHFLLKSTVHLRFEVRLGLIHICLWSGSGLGLLGFWSLLVFV